MKRVIVIGVVVLMLLSVATGVAAAQKTFVLDTVPPGSGSGSGWTDFSLTYDAIGANEGQAVISSTYAIYMVYDPLTASNFSVTGLAAGLGFMMDTSALVAPNGVQASCLNFGGVSVPDGSVLATFHSDTPTTMSFDIDNVLFTIDVDGTGMSGRALETAGQLNPSEGSTPGFSDPVPPVPEIITIVLISIGLIALGGYVWYRRRRVAAITA